MFAHLPWVDKKSIALGSRHNPQLNRVLAKELNELLKQDAQNIAEGIYPFTVLMPEKPLSHFGRIPWILWDGLKIYNRRVKKIHTNFSNRAKQYLEEVPEYLRRNYHFQTDGYLSEQSAELYDHQVELLFTGAADAMRRILLRPLKERLGAAQNLRFLEVACGTGRATRFVKLAFPKAKVIATDVSTPYITVARRRAADLPRVDFLQADACQLPFKDESFDVVYSVFLFHELPAEVRDKVVAEGMRVLKPGGLFALVDSVQLKDFEDAKTALEQFPVDFHEPFFKHYINHPMEEVLEKNGFQFVKTGKGFLSKVVIGQKAALKIK
jgi:ubiquinone/menaquinone biosynthesis C-methylase UbiE